MHKLKRLFSERFERRTLAGSRSPTTLLVAAKQGRGICAENEKITRLTRGAGPALAAFRTRGRDNGFGCGLNHQNRRLDIVGASGDRAKGYGVATK